MKMQSLFLILLIVIAFIECNSTKTDMDLMQDKKHELNAEGVVRDRRGAYGGADLNRKPAKNGAHQNFAVGGISFWVHTVVGCFFLLV